MKEGKTDAKKSIKSLRARAALIMEYFDHKYPDAQCALIFNNPFQLLAATILSAQCTDERVNKTTPELFARFPDAESMSKAKIEDLEEIIRPCGFYHNKAKSLSGMSSAICRIYGGEVPSTMEELIKLPGVGRKTANVVLGNAFSTPGLTVDTHLGRVSRRLGLTIHDDPNKVEHDLAEIIPREKWTIFSHQAIWHGRTLCKARRPLCQQCELSTDICHRIGV